MTDPVMPFDEAGHPPLKISWSGLKDFETCPNRSWQRRQPDYVRPRINGRNFLSGTLADRAVRKWLEQDEPHLPGQMDHYVDLLWEEHAERSDEYKIEWRGDPAADRKKARDLAKKAVNTVEPFLFARVLPHDFQPELRFRVPLRIPDLNGWPRTIYLVGGIDIAVRTAEGQVWLYDLKVTVNNSYVNDVLPQLIFYKIAWHIRMGAPYDRINSAYLVPAAEASYRPLEDNQEDRAYLLTRVVRMAHGIWAERRDLTEDKNDCWQCDCKAWCPRWKREVHITPQGKLKAPW